MARAIDICAVFGGVSSQLSFPPTAVLLCVVPRVVVMNRTSLIVARSGDSWQHKFTIRKAVSIMSLYYD